MTGTNAQRTPGRRKRAPADGVGAAEARAIVLAAQGLDGRLLQPRPGRAHARRALAATRAIQIDGVNVIARAHYLALYARLGPYPQQLLDDLAYRHRDAFEYWGHEASYLPMEDQPLFRWRMAEAGAGTWKRGLASFAAERRDYVAGVLAEVRDRGPLGASELAEQGHRPGTPWWGWSDGKRALEWLFLTGRVMAVRGRTFERRYDLAERVLSRAVQDVPTPPPDEAQRALVARAVSALGVGTAADVSDYYRMPQAVVRERLRDLTEEGVVQEVAVEGWPAAAYLAAGTTVPRSRRYTTLLSPFDSLVWNRDRTERLFGFRYRIEIYTPEAQRRYGYYVLPFLHDRRLVGRVDVRADRENGTLVIPGAYEEPSESASEVADALAPEVRRLAGWLGLAAIAVGERGGVAAPLAAALG